jgi:predicted MFS family arabinose efflux permease
MVLCDTGRALVFAAVPVALALNVLTVWQLYATSFLEGTLFVFFNIAEAAALPRVVPKAQLAQAAAQNQSTFPVAGIIGPSIGTFLYQGVSRMAPFIADAISYAVSVVSLLFVKAGFQRERAPTEGSSLRREIAEGLRWMWAQSLVRFMAFIGAGINLVLATEALILIVLAKRLGAPDGSIGLLFSIGSIGGIVGSVIAAPVQKRFTLRQSIAGCMWVVALTYPLYALAPNIYVLGALTAVVYTVFPVLNVVAYSYRAALVPDELQGRVSSSFRLISWGTQPLGAFVGGFLIERVGVAPTVLVFTAVWFLLATLATLNPDVRAAGHFEDTHAP